MVDYRDLRATLCQICRASHAYDTSADHHDVRLRGRRHESRFSHSLCSKRTFHSDAGETRHPMILRHALHVLAFAATAHAARMGVHKAAEEGQLEPLKTAIRGRYDEYEEVWRKPDLNAKNKNGKVALHLAVCSNPSEGENDLQTVKVLLEAGANASSKDGKDETPLHALARLCDHLGEGTFFPMSRALAAAKLLFKYSADVNAPGGGKEAGLTPLHIASAKGHMGLVNLLLNQGGADVNAVDATGATPLMHAARKLRGKVSHALIAAGADPSLKDAEGRTARDAVADGKDSFAKSIRESVDRHRAIRKQALEEKAAKEKKKNEKRAKSEL